LIQGPPVHAGASCIDQLPLLLISQEQRSQGRKHQVSVSIALLPASSM